MDRIVKIVNGVMMVGKSDGSIIEVPASSYTGKYPREGVFVTLYNNPDGGYIISPIDEGVAGEHVVNKQTYILLTLFLGGIGVHNFYSKHYISGVIYLVLCWTLIPCLFALIDLIRALLKHSDAHGNINI